ncbi:phage tail tape measure protein [Chitinimonas arctica]|uniref:Phage tail tape measure protein n=1 Tax=Chitinimonas arctica TaxID=2594795 RepID=A0A516SHQ8_9NEIS|nr:phage tail tape measure protein [Chitinimonas arctica]QDQ27687.1 phage tail tape measure protein [Chitinimonas arctica]
MSQANLQLQVILSAVERVTAPLRRVRTESNTTSAQVKALRERVGQLNQTAGKIDGYRKTAEQCAKTGQALGQAQTRVNELARELQATTIPTKEMQQAFAEAKRQAGALTGQHAALIEKQHKLRTALAASGIETRQLAQHQRQLRTDTLAATQALAGEEARLRQLNARLREQRAAQTQRQAGMQARDQAAGAGGAMVGAGAVMGLPVLKMVKDYASFEDAMLGVARQVEGARDANGRLTRTYYEMADAIKALSERPGALAANDIAAQVEAAARMGIQGKDNLLAFAKTAGMGAVAFDMAAEEIGDNMGKIANIYKVPIKDIAALGDAINYLDDNAQAKGADIIDVLQRLGGVADKLDYKQAAALGSTFLSLGASAEVAASASNAMVRELAIASMQPKRFREGLQALKLDAKQVQAGMAKDATATILQVLDAIKLLPQAQQMTVTTQLFGKEYGDDAAKLANNLAEYRRQLALVKAPKATGSMQRESEAKSQNLSAHWQTLKNRTFNASSGLGASLRPALLDLMATAGRIVEAVTAWAKANPQLAATLVKVAAVLAVVLTVMGTLTLALAAALGPLVMLRYGMALLGIQFGGGAGLVGMLAGALNKFLIVVGWLGRAVLLVGNVLRVVFAFLLANPIVAVVALIAAAAVYIWANWDSLGPKFAALWASIQAYAGAAWDWICGKASAVSQAVVGLFMNWSLPGLLIQHWDAIMAFMTGLPARFAALGGQVIDGLISGITAKWGELKAKVGELGDGMAGWFKEKLGIHSPSRVFAELGGFTMAGLAQGLSEGAAAPLASMQALLKQLTQPLAAGLAVSASVLASAGTPIDHRAPLPARPAGVAQAAGPVNITINVQAAPGMNEQQLAKLVAAELERVQRKQAATTRSRLADFD